MSRLWRGRKLLRQRLETFARELGDIQGARNDVARRLAQASSRLLPCETAQEAKGIPALTGHKRQRGGRMSTGIAPCEEAGVEPVTTSGGAAAAPATITTTLYDLIAALQEVVHPGEEALVVATVVALLRAGRIRAVAQATSRTTRTDASGASPTTVPGRRGLRRPPRHPPAPTMRCPGPLCCREASIRTPARRRRAPCRCPPVPQWRRSRLGTVSSTATWAVRPAQGATDRTPRALRWGPTSRAARDCGAMAVSLRSSRRSPTAYRTRRSTGA
jgi:hypothetical protein